MFVVMKIDPEHLLKYEREIKVEEYLRSLCIYSKHLLHNNVSKRIYPGTVRPLSTPPGLNPRL